MNRQQRRRAKAPGLAMDRAETLATDPPVSEAQRRAMWSAAEGRSNLGIPRKVGEEFVGKAKDAAGTLVTEPNGAILLLRREKDGYWGLPGGFADEGEAADVAADREMTEETGHVFDGRRRTIDCAMNGDVKFTTYARAVDASFAPTLDAESTGYCWSTADALPQPLHPGLDATLRETFGKDITKDGWGTLSRAFLTWLQEEQLEQAHSEGGMPAEGDPIDFADDRFTDKGPCGGRVTAVADGVITCDVSDEPISLAWEKLAPYATRGDKGWIIDGARRAADAFALDREPENRRYDADGRLHVRRNRISKANVCPYRGNEIPRHEELGLDPEKIYQLYRDAGELEKAAPTANNIPLLSEHVPVTVDAPEQKLVVGSTGTDAEFDAPYLYNSLVFWTRDGVDGVESNDKKELSCAYRYDADMTPGTAPDGTSYDGVMRNIVFNHVAQVSAGRAGPDVVVGDQALTSKENDTMAKEKTSPLPLTVRGLVVYGALRTGLKPLLAADQIGKIKFGPLVRGITAKGWAEQKPKLKAALDAQIKAHQVTFAKDAKLDDVHKFIDRLDPDAQEGKDDLGEPGEEDMEDKDLGVTRDSPADMIRSMLEEAGVPPEVIEKACAVLEEGSDEKEDSSEEEANERRDTREGERDEEVREQVGGKDMVKKSAMDAAIKAATAQTRKETIALMHGIDEAKRLVHPHVGALTSAFDSAEEVYRYALLKKGYAADALKGAPAATLRAMVEAIVPEGTRPRRPLANDAADATSFDKLYGPAAA